MQLIATLDLAVIRGCTKQITLRDVNEMEVERISERGLFWLAGDVSQMTLESATRGTLVICGNEMISLNFDAGDCKWGKTTNMAELLARKFDVVGYLQDRNRYIRIENAFVSKTCFTSTGLAAESLGTFICLMSSKIIPQPGALTLITELRIPLGAFFPWLDFEMPSVDEVSAFCTVKYPEDLHAEFLVTSGYITVGTSTIKSYNFEQRIMDIKRKGWILYKPNTPLNLEVAREISSHIEDLLVIFTSQECSTDFPRVRLNDDMGIGDVFFTRKDSLKPIMTVFGCWVLFSDLTSIFGSLCDKWIELRKRYGPAFHLYLGARRGLNLYEEHRFVNLVWGLESLHRRTNPTAVDEKIQTKMAKIFDKIGSNINSRDRNWLKRNLNMSQEPTLSSRLQEILFGLNLNIASTSVATFSDRCANLRNDISHFGGPRESDSYPLFIRDLHKISSALDHIYHAAILQLIGVPDELILNIFLRSKVSGRIRIDFEEAGLTMGEVS